jgi:hypothetical protein
MGAAIDGAIQAAIDRGEILEGGGVLKDVKVAP